MTKVTITLSDRDGAIAADVVFEGGFQKDSHAHQHAHLMMSYMDTIAQRMEEKSAPALVAPPNVLQLVKGDGGA